MKKRTSILAALCLAAAWCVPAAAADTGSTLDAGQDTRSTTVHANIAEEYEVVIPEEARLSEGLRITSRVMNTDPGMQVRVRISQGLEDGKVSLARENDTSGYAITVPLLKGEAAVTPDTVVAAFADQDINALEGANGALTFGAPKAPDEDPIKAGDYRGFLTFAISYEKETGL